MPPVDLIYFLKSRGRIFFNAFPPESCGVNDNPSVAAIRWWWSYGAIGYRLTDKSGGANSVPSTAAI